MVVNTKTLQASLIKQLEEKGARVTHFEGLIADYLFYWSQEKKMQADVKKRGLFFDTMSAVGKPITKENPSVKQAMMYNKQKLSILKELGLSTDKIIKEEDEEL